MSVNSLDKVASYSPYGQRNAFAAAVEPCAKPAALPAPSPKASMRRMKADETLAIALQAAPTAKTLGEVDFSQENHVDANVLVGTGSDLRRYRQGPARLDLRRRWVLKAQGQ
jgi:hypothetical protein